MSLTRLENPCLLWVIYSYSWTEFLRVGVFGGGEIKRDHQNETVSLDRQGNHPHRPADADGRRGCAWLRIWVWGD